MAVHQLDIRLSEDGQYLTFTVPINWLLPRLACKPRVIPPELSVREREVFSLIIAGLENKDIAQRLHVSPRTVKFHASNIFTKLDLRSRVDLIARYA